MSGHLYIKRLSAKASAAAAASAAWLRAPARHNDRRMVTRGPQQPGAPRSAERAVSTPVVEAIKEMVVGRAAACGDANLIHQTRTLESN